MIRTRFVLPFTASLLVMVTGCPTTESVRQPVATTRLDYTLPIVAPVEPDKQDQEKDGIRVSITPYPFAVREGVQRVYRRKPTVLVVNGQFPVEMQETPTAQVTPHAVRFKVKINNRLERVLRLAGTVVAFQVAGKQVVVDKSHYQEFLNGIILPRQEGEFDIGGPALESLPENATIGLFLYDIVTATDAAGNATQRSNFECYYTLSRQPQSKDVPVRMKSGYVTQQGAELLLRRERERGATGQWIAVPELDAEAMQHWR